MNSSHLDKDQQSIRKNVWGNILFFAVTTLIGVIGTPLYLYYNGFHAADWILFLAFFSLTAMSITVGYHRLFAHRTFKAHPVIEWMALFFGAAAFEQSALRWASQHRDHHRFVDTDQDPYSIKKGFFYAHMGWLMFWKHSYHYENARDLLRNKWVVNQDRYYFAWAIISGIGFPLLLGWFTGSIFGAFILAVCLRLTIVYHSTFFINSVCHMFGKPTYDIHSTAKDHWLVAFLTFGEGYHNFHHRFPNDYRNAVRWYQWDPSKWLIASLRYLGLARDVRRTSKFKIMEARLAAQSQSAREWLQSQFANHQFEHMRHRLDHYYDELREQLHSWEKAARQYHKQMSDCSKEFRHTARKHVKESRRRFKASRRQWKAFQLQEFGLVF